MKKLSPLQGFIQMKEQKAKEAEARKRAYQNRDKNETSKPETETKPKGRIGVYDRSRKK